MRRVYMILAWLVAAGVVVQVAAIAFAKVGEDHLVDQGGVIDKAFVESAKGGSTTFVGVAGEAIHGINGTMVLPLVALLLLISSFFVRGRAAKLWALLVVGLLALQIVVAFSMFDLPYLGIVHGVNALAILLVAITAALKARRVVPRRAAAPLPAMGTEGTEPQDAIQT